MAVTQKYCCNSSRWQVKSIRGWKSCAYCCGYWCCQWRYHQLYPSNYCLSFSNVGDYPIAVTLGDNPNYSVVSTNGILSVTQKYCCNSNSRQVKGIRGWKSCAYCVVTGAVNGGDTINYTLATTATQFSNVGDYPVTLGDNLTIVLFQLMVFLSVTQKYCCNSNSRWQIKSIRGWKSCAYCCGYWCCQWRYHQLYPSNLPLNSLMLGLSIAVTLEIILTIVLFQLMVFLSVTPKVLL
jgi:hypothetical protein